MGTRALHRKLLLSTATLMGALVGYGRSAYAGCVIDAAPPSTSTYHCSGDDTVNLTTETINHVNAEVITDPGFGVDTTDATGDALVITGAGAISYDDANASPLTAPDPANPGDIALDIQSTGDDASSGTDGSVTVNTNGTLIGGYRGILASTTAAAR